MKTKIVREKKDEDQHVDSTPYTSEYTKECEEFPARFQLIKTNFNSFIHNTRALLNDTPLNRGDYSLDDTRKKDIEQCLENWKYLMTIIDYIENNVKRITNELLWCFQGNASGEVFHKFYMINETGYLDADDKDHYFLGTEVVPDVLPLYLFDLQALFMLLASCTVTAWKTQQDIIAIFENKPQKMGDYLNKELKPFWDYLFEFKEQMADQKNDIKEIKESLAGTKKVTQNKQDDLADWVLAGMAQYCKKNQEEINDRINEGIRLPRKPTVIRMFNHWNRYLAADENKKATMQDYVPYPKYENILFDSKDNVEKWGEQIFAPTCLRERAKKKDQKIEKKRKSGKWKPDALDRRLIRGDKAIEKIDELTSKTGEEQQPYFDEE